MTNARDEIRRLLQEALDSDYEIPADLLRELLDIIEGLPEAGSVPEGLRRRVKRKLYLLEQANAAAQHAYRQ